MEVGGVGVEGAEVRAETEAGVREQEEIRAQFNFLISLLLSCLFLVHNL